MILLIQLNLSLFTARTWLIANSAFLFTLLHRHTGTNCDKIFQHLDELIAKLNLLKYSNTKKDLTKNIDNMEELVLHVKVTELLFGLRSEQLVRTLQREILAIRIQISTRKSTPKIQGQFEKINFMHRLLNEDLADIPSYDPDMIKSLFANNNYLIDQMERKNNLIYDHYEVATEVEKKYFSNICFDKLI